MSWTLCLTQSLQHSAIQYIFVTELPSALTSEGEGEHVCAAGTVRMGCNLKINSEYFL